MHRSHSEIQLQLHGNTFSALFRRKKNYIFSQHQSRILEMESNLHISSCRLLVVRVPSHFQAEFKALVLNFKALYSSGPGYLKNHLCPYNPAHLVRSSGGAPTDRAATERCERCGG